MIVVFIIVCLIIAFLVFLMFLVLKKTVGIVNSQTKSYFVNKLQGYDDLIRDKETKLQEIDDLIKDREKGIKEDNSKEILNGVYAFDTNVIDLFNSTQYQDKNIFELNKRIDENFVVNYEELIKDFHVAVDDYLISCKNNNIEAEKPFKGLDKLFLGIAKSIKFIVIYLFGVNFPSHLLCGSCLITLAICNCSKRYHIEDVSVFHPDTASYQSK